jgi:hypothetical protein
VEAAWIGEGSRKTVSGSTRLPTTQMPEVLAVISISVKVQPFSVKKQMTAVLFLRKTTYFLTIDD